MRWGLASGPSGQGIGIRPFRGGRTQPPDKLSESAARRSLRRLRYRSVGDDTESVEVPTSTTQTRPFPLVEQARLDAAAAAASIVVPRPPVADPFSELIDEPQAPAVEQIVRLDRSSPSLRDVARRERIFRWMLAAADAVTAAVAVVVVLGELDAHPVQPLAIVVVPLIVLASKVAGLYDKDERVIDHSTLNELPRLVNLATMFALLVWIARHYLVADQPNTLDLLMMWLSVIGGLVVLRTVARRVAQRVAPVERCLFVGRQNVFERLERKFDGYPGATLIDHVNAIEFAHDHSLLRELVERDHIHRIIIDTDATSSDTLELVRLANAMGLPVSLLPSVLGAVGGSVVFDDIGGLVLMGVPRFGLSRSSLTLKRLFDLVAAGIAIVVLAPLLVVIAAAIKLDSSGPLLFRQTRMGRSDIPFEMLKFRSMVDGADELKDSLRTQNEAAEGLFKIENDPRITRIGRFLRRTGLDELPQLFNVLAGSMSLVGPRPLVIDEDRRVTGFDRRRLHLTPGITGRWQTLGAARVPLAEMVKIDYLYIANWSPWTDLRIIIATVGYLIRGHGQ